MYHILVPKSKLSPYIKYIHSSNKLANTGSGKVRNLAPQKTETSCLQIDNIASRR